MTLDMVISPVYAAALNQFWNLLRAMLLISVDTISIAIMVWFVSSPCALSQCVSEIFTPAVVMPLAALQLPLTITA